MGPGTANSMALLSEEERDLAAVLREQLGKKCLRREVQEVAAVHIFKVGGSKAREVFESFLLSTNEEINALVGI